MILKELLDQTYPYSAKNADEFVFTVVGGEAVLVTFDDTGGLYQVQFSKPSKGRTNQFSITGDGDAFKILATVNLITREWIKNNRPPAFFFTAEESSRRKLYARLANRLNGFMGYNLITSGEHYEMLMDLLDGEDHELFYFENPHAFD